MFRTVSAQRAGVFGCARSTSLILFTCLSACTAAIDPAGPGGSDDDPGAGASGRTGGGSGRAGSGGNSPGSGASGSGIDLACKSSGVAGAVTPLRRLTHAQYRNTLRDLFNGTATVPSVELPDENVVAGYDNNAAGQTASLALLEGYHKAATALAQSATSAANLTKIAPCAAGANEDTCGQQFVATWGKRIFRRPLTTDEATRLVTLFKASRASDGYAAGVNDALQAMLVAPQFLYRVETGGTAQDGFVALDHHGIASRLSYFLWDTLPDAALTAAADAGQLGNADAIGKQVDRLLADDRAKPVVAAFQRQWLTLDKLENLEKSTGTFPKWNADVAHSLRASTVSYIDHMFWSDGKLSSLLTDTHAYVDGKTGWIWGMSNAPTSMGLVDVGNGKRSGILTQAGVMAAFAKTMVDSPVFRGLFVMRQFLCMDVGNPPENVPALGEPNAGEAPKTMRQRQEQSHNLPACIGCHKSIDGIGFGFGHYDAVGAWRDKDNGIDVDATGELVATRDANGKFDGAVELGQKLAKSGQVQQCVSTQWFRYAFGRAETDDDACALRPIVEKFASSQGDMKQLVRAIATSDAFRYRHATP